MNYTDEAATDKEEELCSLLINILFTVMWRGGAPPKERGCVIASINMLGKMIRMLCLNFRALFSRNVSGHIDFTTEKYRYFGLKMAVHVVL